MSGQKHDHIKKKKHNSLKIFQKTDPSEFWIVTIDSRKKKLEHFKMYMKWRSMTSFTEALQLIIKKDYLFRQGIVGVANHYIA